jgi:hypothetical protein
MCSGYYLIRDTLFAVSYSVHQKAAVLASTDILYFIKYLGDMCAVLHGGLDKAKIRAVHQRIVREERSTCVRLLMAR